MMNAKSTIVTMTFTLWILGILVGAAAGDLLPGRSFIPSSAMLAIAFVASAGNFIVLYRRTR
jgi:hypothetical protein